MDKFLIKGGNPLHGTVSISGAKNSALPVLAATLLTADNVTVRNIPKVRDLITMSKLLAFMGASVSVTEIPASDYAISAPTLNHAEAPYELVKTMRASILTLGPLMATPGRGPAFVSPLRCWRFPSRRLCDRRASFRPAFSGAGKNGRRNCHVARLHRSQSAQSRALKGRARSFRENYRHRSGKYFDGCHARGRRDLPRKCRLRTGSDRPGLDAS